jgi:hypothetical protein
MPYAYITDAKEITFSVVADSILPSAPPNIISPEVIGIPFGQSFTGFDEWRWNRGGLTDNGLTMHTEGGTYSYDTSAPGQPPRTEKDGWTRPAERVAADIRFENHKANIENQF